MLMKHLWPILLLSTCLSLPTQAQISHAMTNMARDFWVMFLPNTGGTHQLPTDSCTLIATGPEAADITIATLDDSVTLHLNAGALVEYLCGTNDDVRGRAYHVTSTADIALYARNAIFGSHDVAMIIPTLCLGTKYIGQSAAAASGDTEMLGIIATEDSTVVTVHLVNPNGVPIVPDDIDAPANGMLEIPLQRGEAYIVSTQIHRTYGTFSGLDITSNGRPFALFQGNSAAHVPTSDNYTGNHLFEQAVPYNQWGHVHLTGGVGEPDRNYFLMTSADNNNRAYFNTQTLQYGETMSLDRGRSSTYVQETHHYAAVSTYTTGRMGYTLLLCGYGTSGFCGGPSSVMIPSVEHGVQQAWFTAQQFDPYQENHLIIFCDTGYVHGLRLDGVPVNDSSWLPFLPVQTYRTTVDCGPHRLEADSGTFVAFIYGLRNGLDNSYANPVGMALDPYPRDTLDRTDTTCQYEAYEWGPFHWADGALTDTGYRYLERTLFDPDSIHLYRLHLTVLPAYRSEVRYALMPGDTVVVEDTVIATPGTYIFRHTAANGCDSTLSVVVDYCTAPTPCVELSRPFFDFEYPVVTFTDCSEGAVSSQWTFSDGVALTNRQVRRQLHHPLPDSLVVALHTCNAGGCCADSLFTVYTKARSVWFPNAFTPGSGDDNARFGVFTSLDVEHYKLYVYNRQGQLLFFTDDPAVRWDGTHDGRPCSQGVYNYRWHLRDAYGFARNGTGTVTLLR